MKGVVGQFAVAALIERRNLLNQKPAVIDRRYSKLTHYPRVMLFDTLAWLCEDNVGDSPWQRTAVLESFWPSFCFS